MSEHVVFPRPISVIVVLAAAFLTWWTFVLDIDLSFAWKGWSVVDWMNHQQLPGNFARDFSTGISVYGNSAVLHVYPLAERWLGISPEQMLRVFGAGELLAVALTSYALAWALFDRGRTEIAAILFMYIVASFAADLDLARFGMPYSFTLYYYTAEACRLAAIAFAIRRWYVASALLLALGTITHPTMSVYAGIFIVAAMAITPRDVISRRTMIGAVVFCAIAIPWIVRIVMDSRISVSGSDLPLEQWLDIMRAFNYHFFPVEFGVFTNADQRFLPLLSLLTLWTYYLGRVGLAPETARRLAAGTAAMVVISLIGVALSVLAPSPFVAKISPHRASLLAVLVALPVVIAGLWRDLTSGHVLQRIAAAGALFAPFLMDPGWALVFTVVLCYPSWWPVITGKRTSAADRIVTAMLILTVALSVAYAALGLVSARSHFYRGNKLILYAVIAFVVLSTIIGKLTGKARGRGLAALLLAFVFCWLWLIVHALPEARLQLYADYKAAQIWAREHTPRTSLFMVDPSLHYGWRDFSRRSSFGNLHEWLHTSWVYTSNVAAFREGYARFRDFGIDLAPYLNQHPSVIRGFEALTPVIGQRYNSADDSWRRSMARKYGIDYFVINKRDWKAKSDFPVAYENQSFVILEAPPRVAGPS